MKSLNTRFFGIHSALVTPFDQQGQLDLNAFADLIALQQLDGLNGICIAGTTGEAPTLTDEERIKLVQTAKDKAKGMVVIAGAGSNCTKKAIYLQKSMEDAGADATLQVVPYYNKPTQKGLYEHFSAIAKASSVPVILYNAAGRTGIDIAPKTVTVLAQEHAHIIGIKDANTTMERLIDLIHGCKKARPDFVVLAGEDSALLPFLAMGGDGVISVTSQIAGNEMMALYQAYQRNELVYAQKVAQKLNSLYQLMFSHTNPIPIKTVLAAMGLIEKSFRLPLCTLSEAEEQQLLAGIKKFSFVKNFKKWGVA